MTEDRKYLCDFCSKPLQREDRSHCLECYQIREQIANDDYKKFQLSPYDVIISYQLSTEIIFIRKPLLSRFIAYLKEGNIDPIVYYFYNRLPLPVGAVNSQVLSVSVEGVIKVNGEERRIS